MDIEQLHNTLATIESETAESVRGVGDIEALRGLETAILGRKGTLGSIVTSIKDYPPKQRGEVGKTVNLSKKRVKELFDRRMAELHSADAEAEASTVAAFDPTLPGVRPPLGSVHPVTVVQWEIERAFERLGFTVDAKGRAKDIQVVDSTPSEIFEKSAISALQKWVFNVERKHGASGRIYQLFEFDMEDDGPTLKKRERRCDITGSRICGLKRYNSKD